MTQSGEVPAAPVVPDDWRRELRRKLAWLFAVKLVALTLLWWFFFRGHQ